MIQTKTTNIVSGDIDTIRHKFSHNAMYRSNLTNATIKKCIQFSVPLRYRYTLQGLCWAGFRTWRSVHHQMLWWPSVTSCYQAAVRSTEWPPTLPGSGRLPSSFHDNKRRLMMGDRQSNCPSPAPESWHPPGPAGSRSALASLVKAAVAG